MPPRMPPPATVLALVLALVLAACGGGGDEGVADAPRAEAPSVSDPADVGAQAPDGPGGAGAGAGEDLNAEQSTVSVQGFRFQPDRLVVARGGTVRWVNEDAIGHTATAGTPDAPSGVFDVDLPEQGAAGEFAFTEPGTYAYFCEVHPSMRGEIVVGG